MSSIANLFRSKKYIPLGVSDFSNYEAFKLSDDAHSIAKFILGNFLSHVKSQSLLNLTAAIINLQPFLCFPAEFLTVEDSRDDLLICCLMGSYKIHFRPLVDTAQIVFWGPSGLPEAFFMDVAFSGTQLEAYLLPILNDLFFRTLEFCLTRITGIDKIYAVEKQHLGSEFKLDGHMFGLPIVPHVFLRLVFDSLVGETRVDVLSVSQSRQASVVAVNASITCDTNFLFSNQSSYAKVFCSLLSCSDPSEVRAKLLEAVMLSWFECAGIVVIRCDESTVEIINAPILYPATRCLLRRIESAAQVLINVVLICLPYITAKVQLVIDEGCVLADAQDQEKQDKIFIEVDLFNLCHLMSAISCRSLELQRVWMKRAI